MAEGLDSARHGLARGREWAIPGPLVLAVPGPGPRGLGVLSRGAWPIASWEPGWLGARWGVGAGAPSSPYWVLLDENTMGLEDLGAEPLAKPHSKGRGRSIYRWGPPARAAGRAAGPAEQGNGCEPALGDAHCSRGGG